MTVRISWFPRRSIGGSARDRAVSRRALPEIVDPAIHRASLSVPRWLICLEDKSTSLVADECGNKDWRPVGRRRCQRRDDAAITPRTTAAAVDARTDDIPENARDDSAPADGVLDGNPNDTRDGVPAPGRTDTSRAPGVAARKAAGSRPASGRFCMADRTAGSTCGSSIPATWSQADPGSRGGS